MPEPPESDELAEACPGPDVVIKCTGVAGVVLDMTSVGAAGVVCLTGVPRAAISWRSTKGNNVAVIGSVNANRRHYELAAEAPAAAERSRLERVVTRRVPLESWPEALQRQPDDVKVVIEVDST